MKKSFLLLLLATQVSLAQNGKPSVEIAYAQTIELQQLKDHVYTLASDEYEGRKTGEKGQKMAAEYLRNQYKKLGIAALPGTDDYFQTIPGEFMKRAFSPKLNDSENVIAFIKGSEFPEEYIVLSAHYDHVGMANGEIFNGADDDASGTSAVLEMARVFKLAQDEGKGPKRSIIFLHCTGEEYGLHGSRFFTKNPLVPLENIKADINVDMIGRIDNIYKTDGNYIYLVGSLDEGKHLYDYATKANDYLTQMKIDYTYDDRKHPEMIFYRSDHYNFAKHDIPVLFFNSGIHDDYHQPTDTADKIEYEWMTKRTQLIFLTTWFTANEK